MSLLLPLLLSAGCLGPAKSFYPHTAGLEPQTLYVVSHGWHTGLIVRRESVPRDLWPAAQDFAPANYIEVGWGDDGFYRAPRITTGVTLKALFWPTPSVLHLVAVNDPRTEFAASQMVEVQLSPPGFAQLCAFIGRTHAYGPEGSPIWLAPGIYGDSSFYRARGKYYLPKTCNHWTARALRSAGCPITPIYCITARNVLFQTKRFGREVPAARERE